jgi:hypothetical protein
MQIKLIKNPLTPIWKRTLLWLGIILITIVVAYFIASSQDYYRAEGKDFFSLWLAPHLILEGKNPYNPVDWIPAHDRYGAKWVSDPTFLYPLPLAILLIPLGLLPLEYAAILWVALSILAILSVFQISLFMEQKYWPVSYVLPALIGIFFFRPVTVTLWLGQIDWLILLILAVGLSQWEKQKWFTGTILLTLSVIKPQLGFPLLAFLAVWLIFRRLWKALFAEGITLLGVFAVGWLFDHAWFLNWIEIGRSKIELLFCCTPTLWGLGSLICNFNPGCGFKLGMISALILSAILLIFLAQIPVGEVRFVLGLSIPIVLLVSPYLWTYSQVSLLIPILIMLDILKRRQLPYMLVAPFTLYIALFTSGIVFLSIKIGSDGLSSLVPLVVLVIIFLCYRQYKNKEGLPSRDHAPNFE